ncbi:glycosyltransferase family 4 protein [Karstenula rhodostoma CBS 690.94]|uniref:Glycosyltransferase family 4 protein n=1 Tax=Karstenula rhodostoma CBS 690.94 TaxID=1392251 RepID=A0A9P4PLI8_9PLEO|nr:glycosyltransferase family 4 protein [Karstenula rhodostoma CBS 690.94]
MSTMNSTLQVPRPAMRRQTTRHAFQAPTSLRSQQQSEQSKTLKTLYLGIAIQQGANGTLDLGIASHDGTYSIDFRVDTFKLKSSSSTDSGISGTSTPLDGGPNPNSLDPISEEDLPDELAKFVIDKLSHYREEHLYKFVGAGINKKALELSPQLAARLWQELDIVPLVLPDQPSADLLSPGGSHDITVDEEADSIVRKALVEFGPANQPRLLVGTHHNEVEVDSHGRAQITVKDDYKKTVNEETTWKATLKYAESLKKNKVKIAFFNSTPQGGGVALMRHALIRFLRTLEVDCSWYVPKPKPEVFIHTKNNHNVLQDVAEAGPPLTPEQSQMLDDWAHHNAERYWIPHGGPLASRSNGGADVIIVDDPQLPSLVKIAKEQDPDRPVIFRSHIQVRADLADTPGTPAHKVWSWIWNNVQAADLFISHPVREFIPKTVVPAKAGYLPATTDWLDGLNKELSNWDKQYYLHEFETACFRERMATLAYPARPFIVQIARFDPAKGIPHVLAAYAELRRKYMADADEQSTPQLVIAGHGAIDDTDTQRIYDATLLELQRSYADIKDDVVVMRVGPTDQILNAILSTSHVALQLSTREGFEVKVSEALHKGIPVIATRAGGIPLQVQHNKSGFLVQPGDYQAVAKHLYDLFTDDALYEEMSHYAETHVSDEVGTVGNALSWLYLADALSQGEKLEPNSKWINDMARENAGIRYQEDETRLPRSENLNLTGH